MVIKEPKQWEGQLVPYWLCWNDADNWPGEPDDWNEQHESDN